MLALILIITMVMTTACARRIRHQDIDISPLANANFNPTAQSVREIMKIDGFEETVVSGDGRGLHFVYKETARPYIWVSVSLNLHANEEQARTAFKNLVHFMKVDKAFVNEDCEYAFSYIVESYSEATLFGWPYRSGKGLSSVVYRKRNLVIEYMDYSYMRHRPTQQAISATVAALYPWCP